MTEPINVTIPAAWTSSMSRNPVLAFVMRHPTVVLGGGLLLLLTVISIGAPLLTAYDPINLNVAHRMRPP